MTTQQKSGALRIPVHGTISPKFEAVKKAFIRNFTHRNELGAAVCMYHKGVKVVDLWGGYTDKTYLHTWEADTMVGVFSTTKGVSSLALALLHSRGKLDFDETVAHYWHEFAQNGKENITVRQLLNHQAGLHALDHKLSAKELRDKEHLAQVLARQKPSHEPGNEQAYHAWTIGWYISELIHQIDGRYLAQYLQEELVAPLGIEFYIGLPPHIAAHRVATLQPIRYLDVFSRENIVPIRFWLPLIRQTTMEHRSMIALKMMDRERDVYMNSDKFRSIEIGAANGIGSARSLATLYNEFVTGGKTLKIRPETLHELEYHPPRTVVNRLDKVLKVDLHFSLGFAKVSKDMNYCPHRDAFGTFGAGGSGAFADPSAQAAIAYTLNQMGPSLVLDPRFKALIEAFYSCI
ncbi:MAG: beta-lactamase family protein [Chitinophagales bacterium]|mgnify:CR=1 FL=1|jgi:CubicO group peptidase (beta-lactamase class C family)|nr:beta-lactamase family protein [Chitinophagales bacterium]